MDKKQAPKPTLERPSGVDAAKTPPNDAGPAAFPAFPPIKDSGGDGNEEDDGPSAGEAAGEAAPPSHAPSSIRPQDDTADGALDDIPPLILDVRGHASRRGEKRSKRRAPSRLRRKETESNRTAKQSWLQHHAHRKAERKKAESEQLSFAAKARKASRSRAQKAASRSKHHAEADVQHFATSRALSSRHPRYTKAMRYVVAPLFVIAGVVCFVLAALTATVWRPNPSVSADATVSTRYAVTDPGVLPLANDRVSVSVTSAQPVCAAIGTTQDAMGWISPQNYTQIEGLQNWKQLATDSATSPQSTLTGSSPSDAPTVTFQNSDLWLAVKCGTSVRFDKWNAAADQSVIIDTNPSAPLASTTGFRATVTLAWVRDNIPSQAKPLAMLGILMLLCAILCWTVLALPAHHRRKSRDRRISEQKARARARRAQSSQDKRAPGVGADAPRWVNDHIVLTRKVESRRRHANQTMAENGLARVISSAKKPHIATDQIKPLAATSAANDDVQSTQVLILGDLTKKPSEQEETDTESTQVLDLSELRAKLDKSDTADRPNPPQQPAPAAELTADDLKALKPVLKGAQAPRTLPLLDSALAAGTAFSVTSQSDAEVTGSGPEIVDVRGVNMVARAQGGLASSLLVSVKSDPAAAPKRTADEDMADYLRKFEQEERQVASASGSLARQASGQSAAAQVNKFAVSGKHSARHKQNGQPQRGGEQ